MKTTATNTLGLVGKFCGGATTFAAVISDVLSPIAPFAAYIAIFLGVLIILIIIFSLIPLFNSNLKSIFGDFWHWPIAITVVISFAMMIGAWQVWK